MTCRVEPAASPILPATPPPEPLAWMAGELADIVATDLERPRRLRTGKQGAVIELDGRRLVNVGSNDYLGYAGDVRLAKAASKGSCAEGLGAGASPLVSGHSRAHDALEGSLAALLGVEAAILFVSGFSANVATIAAVVGRGDRVFSDERNHASIIDGCRLSRAEVGIYPHRNLAALEGLLDRSAAARRRLIVTDTLFSMDGTIAPLPELCELARRHRAMLMVDEAHATGVFGRRGSGLVEELGCSDGVHIRVGTLSKALGAAGGFVAGHRTLIEFLRHRARMWIFSTAHPPAVAAAADRAVGLVASEPHRRSELRERAAWFRGRLRGAGIDVGDAAAQIVPVVAGPAAAAVALAARLTDHGYFVPAIRPPSVPAGRSLVRASLCWGHEPRDLEGLADAIIACRG